jgi:ATP-dependent Lon protease
MSEQAPKELALMAAGIVEPGPLADFVAANLPLRPEERQQVLETLDLRERLSLVLRLLEHELEVLEVTTQIQQKVRSELERRQREVILREQLRAIQRELGEGELPPELVELKERLDAAHLPEVARREAERELERLRTIPPQSPEYQVARTYLEWLADLPWDRRTEDNLDMARARQILDEDHADLEQVKERILGYLAVRKLKGWDTRSPILCFVGPPGVGKTSLGQSIARALGRRFVRISLGGVRDEAEIRGHRRTYVGALPGRIIQEIRRAGTKNPLFMLDEVDKLGVDFRGDPAAALLEVLDPAQNHAFVDHYLDVPFDLSQVFFITTANVVDTIPPALRDRMEIIEIPGYTEGQKLEIARRYLLPRQLQENGIPEGMLEVSDEAILELIRSYTREAGVRQLERELGAICRRVAQRIAEGRGEPVVVTAASLQEFLGPPRYRWQMAEEEDEVGVATGMAATPFGGDILYVEATVVPGKGRLILTGKLGEVMQESGQAALTYARSRAQALGVDPAFFERHDVHIHVPAGAIPKDGPSAGITMATALVSAVTRRPVRKGIAMTGEITLRGRVLPVGAIRDKVLAAHRAGIRRVIIPRDNQQDLQEVPAEVRQQMEVLLVSHMDEVLAAALHPEAQEEPAPAAGTP